MIKGGNQGKHAYRDVLALCSNSWAFSFIVFAIQSSGFVYYSIMLDYIYIPLAALDLIVVIVFILNYAGERAASGSRRIWTTYSWVMTIKVVLYVFFFSTNNKFDTLSGLVLTGEGSQIKEISILLSLSGILFMLLSLRAKTVMHGEGDSISQESLLHTDLIFCVLFDFLDEAAFYRSLLAWKMTNKEDSALLFSVSGTFLCLAYFLHAFSFASIGSIQFKGFVRSTDSGEIVTARKHSANIGIICVDIPNLLFRIIDIFWYKRELSYWILKNAICIPLQIRKIGHSFIQEAFHSKNELKNQISNDYNTNNSIERSLYINDEGVDIPPSIPVLCFTTHFTKIPNDAILQIYKNDFDGLNESKVQFPQSLYAMSDEALARFRFKTPPPKLQLFTLLKNYISDFRISSRSALALHLDPNLTLHYGNLLRLLIPILIQWISEITIVSVIFVFAQSSAMKFGMNYYTWDSFKTIMSIWETLPTDHKICIITIAAQIPIHLCSWIYLAPFIDVLFVTLLNTIRLTSFFLLVLTFRDFGILDDLFMTHKTSFMGDFSKYLIFAFAIIPVIMLLNSLHDMIACVFGQSHLAYIATRNQTLALDIPFIKSSVSARNNPYEFDGERHVLTDEAGKISTASLMIFLNCYIYTAPTTIHQMLIGPNLIRGDRLSRVLSLIHKRSTIFQTIIRFWCILMYLSFPFSHLIGANEHKMRNATELYNIQLQPSIYHFSFCSTVFITHILLQFLYIFLSEMNRRLTLDISNKKVMYARITHRMQKETKLNSLLKAPIKAFFNNPVELNDYLNIIYGAIRSQIVGESANFIPYL